MAIPLRAPHSAAVLKPIKVQRKSTYKDPKLWAGVLLFVASAYLGQQTLRSAGARTQAVVLVNDLTAGARISTEDVQLVGVAVPDTANLVADPQSAIGMTVRTDVFAGDLLNVKALGQGELKSMRNISVPLRAGHVPAITNGSRVDVWVTPATTGMELPGPSRVIISAAVVVAAPDAIDSTSDTSATLAIPTKQVQGLVQAMRDGLIDLVVVPSQNLRDGVQ